MPVSPAMWVLLFGSLGALAVYGYLILRDNRKLLKRLLTATGPKEWIVATYLVFGLGLVTAGVYFVPSVPNPNALPVFQSGLEALVFGVSWGVVFFLATVSYGLFRDSRSPELYLLGFLIFLGAFSLTFMLLLHTDFGSQLIQGLIVVGLLAILSSDRLEIELRTLSVIVLGGFSVWLVFTGASAIFRVEPQPTKAIIYTGFVMLGAVWVFLEGSVTARKRQEQRFIRPESPNPDPRETREGSSMGISPTSICIPLLGLYCLGPFRLVQGEEPIDDWVLKSNQKPLEILKLIAVSPGRDVSRDRLIDALWGDSLGEKAAANFQKNLSRLRALIDGPVLKSRKESYVLARGGSFALHPEYTWVDIEEFVTSTNTGHRYRQDGLEDQAMSAFEKASELWRGTLLEGQAPEPWLGHERKQLEETCLNLHIEAAKLCMKKVDFTMTERWIKKGLAVNPDSEQGVRIMALAQYEQGKKSDALKNLEDFTARLKKMLQTEPSPKTVKLRSLIRTDKKISPAEWM